MKYRRRLSLFEYAALVFLAGLSGCATKIEVAPIGQEHPANPDGMPGTAALKPPPAPELPEPAAQNQSGEPDHQHKM